MRDENDDTEDDRKNVRCARFDGAVVGVRFVVRTGTRRNWSGYFGSETIALRLSVVETA